MTHILAFLIINGIIGAVVWGLMDSDGKCYKWYISAPYAWCQFLALQLWPVGLMFHVCRKWN
jgi:hypothetical protein